MRLRRALIVVIALASTGCQFGWSPVARLHSGGQAGLSEEALQATAEKADWSRVVDLTIRLRDYGFAPDELRLRVGQPYRLTVINIGGHGHYFNAPEFMRSVATRHVVVRDQVEVKGQKFSSFEVARRGGRFELEFVPLAKGTYRAYCHLEGDAHRGVEGRIIVQ